MNYRTLIKLEDIKEYLQDALLIAFDFETAPDENYRTEEKAALDPHKAHIVGVSFSVKEADAIYVPLTHCVGNNAQNQKDIWEFLKNNIFESQTVIKVAHNLAFESMFLYAMGIILQSPCYDTIAAAQLTLKSKWEFRTLHDSGLKLLATSLFGAEMPSFMTVTGGRPFDEMNPCDFETIRYACADSDYTLRLYHKFNAWFERFLPKHRFIVEKIESPTAVYCGIMKYNGIPVDKELMLQKQEESSIKSAELKAEIDNITGGVNIGANASTSAFKQYLYKELGLPVLKTTEKHQEAADDQALIMLRDWCRDNKPHLVRLFDLVQAYRKWGKLKSTYIDGYLQHINSLTGRIHPDLMPLGTQTGRFAARNPNLQNCPRKDNDPIGIRQFIVSGNKYIILSLDFSQIELRVGAFYCRDEKMLETYKNGGDIHAQTTAVIYNIPFHKATDKNDSHYKERRTIAKNCNFGVFYGLFPSGLQRTLHFKAGLNVTMEECETIINNLKAGYPGLQKWQDKVKTNASNTCYTETWLGRRRYIVGIRSEDWNTRSFAERCALNTPVQGTAADILKLACGRIIEGLVQRPWLKPLLQIHDELVFELPENKINDAVKYIKACMEQQPYTEFDVPIVAEASVGYRFGEMKELEVLS